ncbi:MAG: hypothetical protein GXY44_03965 [Phycisphaerales bacterium]|nr:hypothetical protein [Phycisphaerales bacterium]
MLRGGSWNNHPRNCRSANRNRNNPDNRNNNNGFRVVAVLAGVHLRGGHRRGIGPEFRPSSLNAVMRHPRRRKSRGPWPTPRHRRWPPEYHPG